MYKKLLLLPAILAGFASLIAVPVSAKEVRNGTEYWSVSEMREFMLQVEAELTSVCGSDSYCKEDLIYERAETNGQYRALRNFEWEKLIVTSINPAAETIKLYYQNEDKMASRLYGHPRVSSIEDFYMLWVEEWLGNPYQNGSWLTYGERYPYFLGDAATVESASHLMIDEDKARNGADWFAPNVEREYKVTGSGLQDNTSQRFYYSLLESNGGRTNGIKDYKSCFDGTDYQPGMECRLLYGSDGISRYFPFVPADATSSSTTDTSTVDTPTTTVEIATLEEGHETVSHADRKTSKSNTLAVTSKPIIIEIEDTKSTASSRSTTESVKTNSLDTDQNKSGSTDTVGNTDIDSDTVDQTLSSTPSMSLPKSGSCEKELIFPWWFIILIAASDIIIMWFFWPKSSKKGLTKE